MNIYYSGEATIDEQMGILKADEGFSQFIGQNIYGSVTHSIHPDDRSRFQSTFNELLSTDRTENIVVLRAQRGQTEAYEWSMLRLTYESFDLKGKRLVHVELYRLTDVGSDEAADLEDEATVWLKLLGGTLLSYDMETKELELFLNCDGQRLTLYKGDFTVWKDTVMAGKVDQESLEMFRGLCRDIEAGGRNFHYRVKTSAFSENGDMELCTFRCRTITNRDKCRLVLGCVTLHGERRDELADAEYSQDAGVPVLDKKSITSYAKRSILAGRGMIHVIILDLDDFKNINDTYGHMRGDEVLLKATEVIKDAVGGAGVVGRIGGDEMMVVLHSIESHAELRNMLRLIRTGIDWMYKDTEEELHVTCSMGVASYPDHGDTYEKVFELADRMLYVAKDKGKNRYVIYTPELHDPETSKQTTVRSVRQEELRENKAGVMQMLIENFLIRKTVPYEHALQEVALSLDLDEVLMVYNEMRSSSTWTPEGFFSDLGGDEVLRLEESFLQDFDENGTVAANGIFNMEVSAPVLSRRLADRGIESAFFYQMKKDGKMFGYVMFAKKSHRQMWSEYDKTLLAAVGKILEQSFLK